MEYLYVIVFVLLLCLVVGIVWLARRQASKQKREQAGEILYLLDRVAEAAAKRKNQLYQSLDGSDNQALKALEEAVANSRFDISDELKEIDALWTKLSQQVGEFSEQSVQSTLRSSVVTSQAAQVSKQITDLVSRTKKKLEA